MDAPTPEGDSDAHTGPLAGHEDTCRVLIVDDEPDLRRLLGEVLADQGWSVAEAHHGEHALDRLQAERFAVVLLDHRMPGLSGGEVYSRLRAAGDATPVILMTAARNVHELAHSLGIPHFIAKPFDLEELVTMIKATSSACT